MEELRAILIAHAKRYPLMQPTDAVKLIYQNEFGGGHLIRDEEACLNYLRREYADLEKDPTAPLYEDIGNGIVRVNLAAIEPEDLDQLGKNFIDSAAKHSGKHGKRNHIQLFQLLEHCVNMPGVTVIDLGLVKDQTNNDFLRFKSTVPKMLGIFLRENSVKGIEAVIQNRPRIGDGTVHIEVMLCDMQ